MLPQQAKEYEESHSQAAYVFLLKIKERRKTKPIIKKTLTICLNSDFIITDPDLGI